MVKQAIAFFLAFLLLLGLMMGCTPGQNKDDNGDGDKQTNLPEETGIVITEEYVIVFPQTYNLFIDRASSVLQIALEKMTGVNVKIVNERTEPTEKEIVLGACNRFDAASMDAPITLQGEKLIFYAESAEEIYCVAEAFVERCISAGATDAQGRLVLNEEIVSQIAQATTRYDEKISVLTQNLRYADDAGGNSVAERSERFLALIEEYDPDIIGTQEATPLWKQYLEEYFSDEYTMVGVSRDGTGAAGDESNFILYRTDRFELVESGTFWLYEDNPDKVGKVKDALCNRICTWAILKDHHSGEKILVCNTHLDHSTDTIRAEQLTVLFDYLSFEIDYYPVILTGDFNTLRDSTPYKAISAAGLLDGQRKAWVDESNVTYSCHLYQNSGSIIDYCFHSADFVPFYSKIISDDYGGYVSDHYGVLVELVPAKN